MNEAITRIAKRLTGLIAKRPGLVLAIWGEPGIGKTHTVKELLRETPCRNLSLHATTSPADIARVLPRPSKLPVWAERTLERVVKGEQVETSTLTDALGAALSGLAPFVLHLEDLHETSSTQLEFVQALAKIIARLKGVGLIVTSREQPPEGFEALRLEPLSSQTVKEILQAEVRADLPTEALDWLQTRAAGNPLFSLEYFRYLSRQGFVWSDGQKWRWRVPTLEIMPTTVEVLIEHITAKAMLNPTLEIVIQAKAFLGRSIQLELWAAVANVTLEILEASKTELEREGILLGSEFAHPLYAEVIERNLGIEKRQTLARRAIDALEHDPEAAAVFVKDAKFEPELALELLERAIQQARYLRHHAQAARFLAKMVEYAPEGERRTKMEVDAASALYDYDLSEAIRLLKVAHLAQPEDTQILFWLTNWLAQAGRREEVENLLTNVPIAEQTNERQFTMSIQVYHYLQDRSQVIELWNAHPELHFNASPDTVRFVAFSMADLGDTLSALGLLSTALNQSSLEVSDRAVLLEAYGFACFARSDFFTAVQYYTQAIELFRKHGQRHRTGSLLFNRAIALQNLARFSESLADAEESLYMARDGGHALAYFNAQLAMAATRVEQGNYELAEELLLSCQSFYAQIGIAVWQIDVQIGLSELYREWKTMYSGFLARRHAEKALTLARGTQNLRYVGAVMPYAILAEALFGDALQALELAEEADLICRNQGDAVVYARVISARATAYNSLGRFVEALGSFQQALKLTQQAGALLEAAKIQLEIAGLTKDFDTAQTLLKWFLERDLLNTANIARRYFPELASDTPRVLTMTQTKLEVFGAMQFVTENSSLPVRGQKRRELLALLLEARIAGRKEVARLELLDALYPNSDEMESGASLKDIVYQVREIAGSSSILTSENGYALGEITTDAETFLETGNTQLWRGAYLDGLNLERNNETVRETLHFALRSNANSLLESDPTEAARIGRLLCDFDPYDLEALQLTVKALRAAQNHKTLSRVYIKARDQLLEIGEVLPMHWQDFLENQIGITA